MTGEGFWISLLPRQSDVGGAVACLLTWSEAEESATAAAPHCRFISTQVCTKCPGLRGLHAASHRPAGRPARHCDSGSAEPAGGKSHT